MTRNYSDTRGRLTPVDVVYYGVAVLLLGFLAEPMYTVMNDNAGELGTGTAYLFQLAFPAMVVTVLTVVYLTGVSGGAK
ncbi:hypothetical protein [Haladaptatus cibarius]|uniref:hypothetical protein n=1 Tax=Haladaptatus cibarius TaxID=453847 RepID=UPI000678CFDA|nr:hypothetical protein [Haladaptatus cibarius]